MQRMDSAAKGLAVLAIALVLGVGASDSSEAEVTTAAGYLRKIVSKTATGWIGTTSTTYENVGHGL